MSPEGKYPPLEDKIGRLGRDPEERENNKGKFQSFSIGVTRAYGQPGQTDWVSVAVYKPELQAFAKTLRKGQRVAVKGNYREKRDGDRTYYDIQAFELYRTSDLMEQGDDWE